MSIKRLRTLQGKLETILSGDFIDSKKLSNIKKLSILMEELGNIVYELNSGLLKRTVFVSCSNAFFE